VGTGSVAIIGSTVAGNIAQSGSSTTGGLAAGGGIFAGTTGRTTLLMIYSTVSSNRAEALDAYGAGIDVVNGFHKSGTPVSSGRIIASTIADNSTGDSSTHTAHGGGIYFGYSTNILSEFTTVAYNSVTVNSSLNGNSAEGAGIYEGASANEAESEIDGVIVGMNSPESCAASSGTFSLEEKADDLSNNFSCGFEGGDNHANLNLGPLGFYGGVADTVPLLPGSVAANWVTFPSPNGSCPPGENQANPSKLMALKLSENDITVHCSAGAFQGILYPPAPPPPGPTLTSLSPSSGPLSGGTKVTITGDNLLGTGFVYFGSKQASFQVISNSEIVATTPASSSPGNQPVKVIGPGGTSNELKFSYVATTQPPPSSLDITPTRICDTRAGNPSKLTGTALTQCEGKTQAPGQSLVISIPGVTSDPSVLLGITVIDPGSPGYLTITPNGASSFSSTSEVTVTKGVNQTTSVLVDTSSTGQVAITNHTGSYLNLAVDLESLGNLPLVPINPTRICDTRQGNPSHLTGTALTQCEGKAPASGTTLQITPEAIGDIPSSSIKAVLAQVTDIDPDAPGYLTLWSGSGTRPVVSQVTNIPGQITSNLVLIPLNSQGDFSVYSSSGDPNLAIDIEGYVPENPTSATSYLEAAPSPTRICDTRADNPSKLTGTALTQCEGKAPGQKGTLLVSVDPANLPSSTTAAFVSITATQATKASYLTAWDGEGTPPTTSVSNPAPGMTETTSPWYH